MIDKAISLLKLVDSPFKLFAVVLIGFLGFGGYMAWELREDLKHALKDHPVLKDQKDIEQSASDLLRDTEALAIIVHEMNIQENSRVTRLALSKDGSKYRPLQGYTVSLFNNGQNKRNKATIAILRGEIYCAPFKSSSKAGKYMDSKKVTYMCRGGIGPIGKLHGYAAVGFASKPKDIESTKARIVIALKEMCR